ncbi:hypothetical protein COT04_02555 [Candidatus Shapirobacteria bacterium CG07_land_8_20_14_0_80_39_12]|uniref:DUF3307 domain-containing protein n=2 Tax=Candidatus Shapironibacteriota TaxID=1752721 RepID=A0A2M6YPD8_9BACT|nr:MAG: hypothetical protein COT04_02555 [Candidatus Shapirobacteria bacterium CG07_land_8_20_14_0_80_39_12]PJA50022.1 MAG: hypothetical protein CO169_00300 [Candidatus Shapirobacteria bacterium CG_4_9_14_3_um_filter_39_13]
MTSALIVSKVSPPALSLPLVLVFHYLLDIIPHWDTGSGLTNGLKTKRKAVAETIFDLVIAAGLVFFFFQRGKVFSPLLWGGVILGLLPDLLELPSLFFGFRPFPLNYLEKFHTEIMHRRGKLPWGFLTQLILIALISLLA